MKKQFLIIFSAVILSIVLSFGIRLVLAWTEPTCDPTKVDPSDCNVSPPVMEGEQAQDNIKTKDFFYGDDLRLGHWADNPISLGGDIELHNAVGTATLNLIGDSGANDIGLIVLKEASTGNPSEIHFHQAGSTRNKIYEDDGLILKGTSGYPIKVVGEKLIAPEICLPDVDNCNTAWPVGGDGDITAVNAGSALTGGGDSGDVTLSLLYDTNTLGLENMTGKLLVKDIYVKTAGDTMSGQLNIDNRLYVKDLVVLDSATGEGGQIHLQYDGTTYSKIYESWGLRLLGADVSHPVRVTSPGGLYVGSTVSETANAGGDGNIKAEGKIIAPEICFGSGCPGKIWWDSGNNRLVIEAQ